MSVFSMTVKAWENEIIAFINSPLKDVVDLTDIHSTKPDLYSTQCIHRNLVYLNLFENRTSTNVTV
jgi:hypothetical protein